MLPMWLRFISLSQLRSLPDIEKRFNVLELPSMVEKPIALCACFFRRFAMETSVDTRFVGGNNGVQPPDFSGIFDQ